METVWDALKAMVNAAGGPKVVGHKVYPAKSPDDARVALLNAINPDRPEKLDPEQMLLVLRLAREAGFHAGKHWIDDDCGYAASDPIEPDDQAAELARVIAGAGEQLRRATDALERLQGRKARR